MAGFFRNLLNIITNKADIDWDDLEAMLIAGDLGPRLAMEVVDDLKAQGRRLQGNDVVQVARDHVRGILPSSVPALNFQSGKPTVLLIVGVNGTGKTTSTAKLARLLHQAGRKVTLAAADTFRAAAVEQLEVWSQRLGIPLVKGPPNGDPAAVCFEGYERATKDGEGAVLICDTAGRLHTKHNLMEELKKVHRVLGRKDAESPHEVLLVVDATTGSNALQQAREFHKAIPLTGLIATKLDGSGKGGVIVAIQQELGIATRFIGLGERAEDFQPFDPKKFVDELL